MYYFFLSPGIRWCFVCDPGMADFLAAFCDSDPSNPFPLWENGTVGYCFTQLVLNVVPHAALAFASACYLNTPRYVVSTTVFLYQNIISQKGVNHSSYSEQFCLRLKEPAGWFWNCFYLLRLYKVVAWIDYCIAGNCLGSLVSLHRYCLACWVSPADCLLPQILAAAVSFPTWKIFLLYLFAKIISYSLFAHLIYLGSLLYPLNLLRTCLIPVFLYLA